jgi:hypothetical protein
MDPSHFPKTVYMTVPHGTGTSFVHPYVPLSESPSSLYTFFSGEAFNYEEGICKYR